MGHARSVHARPVSTSRNREPIANRCSFFYPTVSTHAVRPLAPYQKDWASMLGPQPFTLEQVNHAYASDPRPYQSRAGVWDAVSYATRPLRDTCDSGHSVTT